MRLTKTLVPTLREVPAEADIISHQLLLRAGMLRKVAAGVYTLLPLGYQVVRKIERIVRQEMDRAGGVELLLPIMQPAELWQESGRWAVYGPEMFKLQDRHEHSFCLGPTHEEVITDLVRQEIKSYRQLPLMLYQIQNKYRDERRPRFGLLRGREFIMKDLYSFDRDTEGLDLNYQKMYEAYSRIFTRCGLNYRVVEADPGAIGGGETHEFMVLADTGEAEVAYCSSCDYAADIEKAPCQGPSGKSEVECLPLQEVPTPGMKTVLDLAAYLHSDEKNVIKTMFYNADQSLVAVLVRGDRSVNEIKVQNFLGAVQLEIADEASVVRQLGVPFGFLGPVGIDKLGIRIMADQEIEALVNAVAGANALDTHLLNVNPGRDFTAEYGDFRRAEVGDRCPVCGFPFKSQQGIEVGQIFKLGTKYSKALGAMIIDEQGREIPIVMGCYGIGVTRTMAAAVEQKNDENGIIWPVDIAPYEVIVVPINARDEAQVKIADDIYNQLNNNGLDVIYDDRPERAGVKFKDADLIGYPVRIVVGKQAVAEGLLEIKWRHSGETILKPLTETISYVRQGLDSLRTVLSE